MAELANDKVEETREEIKKLLQEMKEVNKDDADAQKFKEYEITRCVESSMKSCTAVETAVKQLRKATTKDFEQLSNELDQKVEEMEGEQAEVTYFVDVAQKALNKNEQGHWLRS